MMQTSAYISVTGDVYNATERICPQHQMMQASIRNTNPNIEWYHIAHV